MHKQTDTNMEPPGFTEKRNAVEHLWRREIDRGRERIGVTSRELCKTAEDRDAFRG